MNGCDRLLISRPTPYDGIPTPLLVWGSSPLSASETTINLTSATVQLSTPEPYVHRGVSRQSGCYTTDEQFDTPLTPPPVEDVHLPCAGGVSE